MSEKKPKTKPSKVVYKLKHPFEWGSETISEIEISRPKGKHLKKFGEGIKIGDMVNVASACSGHAPPVFDEMDGEDYVAIVGIVSNFLDSGQGTGKSNLS